MAFEGFLKPEEVVEAWDVRPGEKVADFGCGAGFFSIPLAQKVGTEGKVYALDIRSEAVEATRAKAKLFHLFNIEASRANLETTNGSGLRDGSIDKVLIANILFQAENKSLLIKEAARILRPEGMATIIEWDDKATSAGPSLESRIGKQEAKSIFAENGLAVVKEFSAGTHHYGIIFKKQA